MSEATLDSRGFILSATLLREKVASFGVYPFNLPAIRPLETLPLHRAVTFLVGENGSGKSTLLEGLAIALGFNAEGGSRNFNFARGPAIPIWGVICASPAATAARARIIFSGRNPSTTSPRKSSGSTPPTSALNYWTPTAAPLSTNNPTASPSSPSS